MVNSGLHTPWTINPLSRDLGRWTPTWIFLGNGFARRAANSALSQERLAHESGLDRSYVGRVERGEHNLTFVSLVKIARALGRDVAALTVDLPLIRRSTDVPAAT